MRKKLTWEEIVDRSKKIHNDKYIYEKQDYKNGASKINFICKIHGEYTQSIESHLQGRGCAKCSGNSPYTVESLKEKMLKLYNNKYSYNLSNFKNNESKIDIFCKKHGKFTMKVSNHLHGQECKFCSHCVYTNSKFIELCNRLHNGYYDYSKVDYKNHKSSIVIKCPSHGEFTQNARTHLRGHGCTSCNLSKGEILIEQFLKSSNIKYYKQMKLEGCSYKKKLPFDFYLPDINMCIEFDGYQHFSPIKFFGGEEAFNAQKKRDEIKNKYCKENGIKLLRISYIENIGEKIISIINEIHI
jgi:very-short-patch-repair endonuclease